MSSPHFTGFMDMSEGMRRITWEWLGGFYDGEGSAYFGLDPETGWAWAYFFLTQGSERRHILEESAEFIEKETGIVGSIYDREEIRDKKRVLTSRYEVTGFVPVYTVLHHLLPHIKIRDRIETAKNVMSSIEEHVKTMLKAHEERVHAGLDWVSKSWVTRFSEMLEQIESLKHTHVPY